MQEANGVIKEHIAENIGIAMFKGWWNHKLPFSNKSYAAIEQDKCLNVWVGFLVALSCIHCQSDERDWEINNYSVSEGALAPIADWLLDRFKDQGCKKDDKDDPKDDLKDDPKDDLKDDVFCKKLKKKQMLKECNIDDEIDKKIELCAFEIDDVVCTVKQLSIH